MLISLFYFFFFLLDLESIFILVTLKVNYITYFICFLFQTL